MIDFLIFIYRWIPDFVVNLITLAAIVGILASYIAPIPAVKKLPLRIASVVTLFIASYLQGGLSVVNNYKQKVKEFEQKIKVSEEKAREENVRIEYVYIERVKDIKEEQKKVEAEISNISEKIDAQCTITNDTIDILNKAIKR